MLKQIVLYIFEREKHTNLLTDSLHTKSGMGILQYLVKTALKSSTLQIFLLSCALVNSYEMSFK